MASLDGAHSSKPLFVCGEGALGVRRVLEGRGPEAPVLRETVGRGQFDRDLALSNLSIIKILENTIDKTLRFFTHEKTNEIIEKLIFSSLRSARKFCCYLRLAAKNNNLIF